MIENTGPNEDVRDFSASHAEDLLGRLCESLAIDRADLLEPFDPTFPSSSSAERILRSVEDSDLRACLASLLFLQERKARSQAHECSTKGGPGLVQS